ncbi:MAG: ribosomal protein S18 acetylase RimI-like enzyme [Cellvibrionaceae bacterium]|jgi:ribosomal protein S18 acetylase RimI-like enzyme
MKIRPYQSSDLDRLYHICLLTTDNGKDGSHLFSDPKLNGYMYAAPYAIFEPELCFVLVNNDNLAIGYILGTKDTATFGQWCEKEWFPPIREQFPLPAADDMSAEANLIRSIHNGHDIENWLPGYPAHLHIDILPEGQSGGWGLKLMETFWNELRELGVPGVFLGVSKQNENAVGFYRHIGFDELQTHDWGYIMGKKL